MILRARFHHEGRCNRSRNLVIGGIGPAWSIGARRAKVRILDASHKFFFFISAAWRTFLRNSRRDKERYLLTGNRMR